MAKLRKKWAAALVGAAALSLTLTACGGGGSEDEGGTSEGGAIDTSTATGDINYWLWDANQLPASPIGGRAFSRKPTPTSP